MRKLVIVALAVVLAFALAGCQPAAPVSQTPPQASTPAPVTPPAQMVYTAKIQPINSSGVQGDATVTVAGTDLQVEISATGMVPGQVHAMHIHGMPGGQASTCPVTVKGVITPEPKAESSYGHVLDPLSPFPTASAAGEITFNGSVGTSSAVPGTAVLPLDGKAIVLHGLMVNGKYDPSVPVGCGTLALATGQ